MKKFCSYCNLEKESNQECILKIFSRNFWIELIWWNNLKLYFLLLFCYVYFHFFNQNENHHIEFFFESQNDFIKTKSRPQNFSKKSVRWFSFWLGKWKCSWKKRYRKYNFKTIYWIDSIQKIWNHIFRILFWFNTLSKLI